MKRIHFVKMLLVAVLVGGSVNAWGAEELLYSLTATKNASNSSYSSVYDVTINEIKWSIPGNQALTTTPPWKFGGKLSSATDKILYSQGSISGNISKIIITHGSKDNQITVNSCTVSVYSTADDAKNGTNPISSISATYIDNGSMTIEKPNDVSWKDCYYRIVYNLSSSASSKNYGILFSKAEFYGSSGSGETTDYTVHWMVGGAEYTTTSVKSGSKATPPIPPADNALSCANTFMGWSKQNLGSGTGQGAPSDLFKDESPDAITANTIFYAVFATKQTN